MASKRDAQRDCGGREGGELRKEKRAGKKFSSRDYYGTFSSKANNNHTSTKWTRQRNLNFIYHSPLPSSRHSTPVKLLLPTEKGLKFFTSQFLGQDGPSLFPVGEYSTGAVQSKTREQPAAGFSQKLLHQPASREGGFFKRVRQRCTGTNPPAWLQKGVEETAAERPLLLLASGVGRCCSRSPPCKSPLAVR